jgi:thiamine biosynthesis lipoprotein
MAAERITRRRALVILASAMAYPASVRAAGTRPFEWRGTALGADARLLLWAANREKALEAINACVAEIERLEQVFSLYRTSSEICRLNRRGVLEAPSHDMIRLLHLSRHVNQLSEGLFDPTVQSLWELYAGWYAGRPGREAPPAAALAAARARVGMEKIDIGTARVACRDGARMTLNGIAQGYITDRAADLLRARGWRHVLIDLGELRALDARPDGAPWRIGIRETGRSVPLTEAALATSSGDALRFGRSADTHHIFDPRTGRSSSAWRAVTVQHASAATADALSTALVSASAAEIERIAQAQENARIWATRTDGSVTEYPR